MQLSILQHPLHPSIYATSFSDNSRICATRSDKIIFVVMLRCKETECKHFVIKVNSYLIVYYYRISAKISIMIFAVELSGY